MNIFFIDTFLFYFDSSQIYFSHIDKLCILQAQVIQQTQFLMFQLPRNGEVISQVPMFTISLISVCYFISSLSLPCLAL